MPGHTSSVGIAGAAAAVQGEAPGAPGIWVHVAPPSVVRQAPSWQPFALPQPLFEFVLIDCTCA